MRREDCLFVYPISLIVYHLITTILLQPQKRNVQLFKTKCTFFSFFRTLQKHTLKGF